MPRPSLSRNFGCFYIDARQNGESILDRWPRRESCKHQGKASKSVKLSPSTYESVLHESGEPIFYAKASVAFPV